MRAAVDAGATVVAPIALHLRGPLRDHYLGWLARRAPRAGRAHAAALPRRLRPRAVRDALAAGARAGRPHGGGRREPPRWSWRSPSAPRRRRELSSPADQALRRRRSRARWRLGDARRAVGRGCRRPVGSSRVPRLALVLIAALAAVAGLAAGCGEEAQQGGRQRPVPGQRRGSTTCRRTCPTTSNAPATGRRADRRRQAGRRAALERARERADEAIAEARREADEAIAQAEEAGDRTQEEIDRLQAEADQRIDELQERVDQELPDSP